MGWNRMGWDVIGQIRKDTIDQDKARHAGNSKTNEHRTK